MKMDGDDWAFGQNYIDKDDVHSASGVNPMWNKNVQSGYEQNPISMDGDDSICGRNSMDKSDIDQTSG